MKYIFLNLKRFDIIPEYGGVNSIAPPAQWGAYIVEELSKRLARHPEFSEKYQFPIFLPEAHLIPAAAVLNTSNSIIKPQLGCQSVYHTDTANGGNFGAFTTLRTANSVKQLGCQWTIIGHSEERKAKTEYMTFAGASQENIQSAINKILAQEIVCAQKAGLKVRVRSQRLVALAENFPVEVLLVRDDDIPGLVMDGTVDLGIVGEGVLEETKLSRAAQGLNASYTVCRRLDFGE